MIAVYFRAAPSLFLSATVQRCSDQVDSYAINIFRLTVLWNATMVTLLNLFADFQQQNFCELNFPTKWAEQATLYGNFRGVDVMLMIKSHKHASTPEQPIYDKFAQYKEFVKSDKEHSYEQTRQKKVRQD